MTIGGVLGMAAHLEGKGVGIIDQAGLAQKGGAVVNETIYWELLNALSAASSLAELAAIEQQVRAQPLDERRRDLGEVLFLQRRMLEASAVRLEAGGTG